MLPAMQSKRFVYAPAVVHSLVLLKCSLTASEGRTFVFPHVCSYGATLPRGDAEQAMGLNYDRVHTVYDTR